VFVSNWPPEGGTTNESNKWATNEDFVDFSSGLLQRACLFGTI
jgi:hypothetical protein